MATHPSDHASFTEWRTRDAHLSQLRAHAHARLVHSTWAAAVIARLKDEEVLMKRRNKPEPRQEWREGRPPREGAWSGPNAETEK